MTHVTNRLLTTLCLRHYNCHAGSILSLRPAKKQGEVECPMSEPPFSPTLSPGKRLKEFREARHLSRERVSQDTSVPISTIEALENGRRGLKSSGAWEILAQYFGMSVHELKYGYQVAARKKRLEDVISELNMKFQELPVVEVFIRGYVGAGVPCPQEQVDLGTIAVLKEDLAGMLDPSEAFALKVKGDSLIGDNLNDADLVLIDPNQREIVNGKIYYCEVNGNECVLRHVSRIDGLLRLYSSNDKYRDLRPAQVEIKGRATRRIPQSQAL